MQFSVICDRVADYLDRSDLTARIEGWVNDTRKDIALSPEVNLDYLYTEATCETSAGTARYALPTDYLGHLSIFVGTKKLVKISPREYEETTGDDIDIVGTDSGSPFLYTTGSLVQGEPDYYIDRGMEFDLYPTPDATYTITIKYYAQPADFDEDTDEDYLSRFHFEAIIFGASVRGALFLDDGVKIQQVNAAYDQALKKIIQRDKKKKSTDVAYRMKTYKDYSLGQFKRLMHVDN